MFNKITRLLLLAGLSLSLAMPISSAVAGSTAWVTKGETLFGGPSHAYGAVGDVVQGDSISVERCTGQWCQVITDKVLGWMSRSSVSFGQEARAPLTGPHFDRKHGGSGEVCFYSHAGFSGRALCAPSGYVLRDLKLAGMDNTFASVTVSGKASVLVCSGAFFHAYCEHVTSDQPDLGKFLSHKVSAIRVY